MIGRLSWRKNTTMLLLHCHLGWRLAPWRTIGNRVGMICHIGAATNHHSEVAKAMVCVGGCRIFSCNSKSARISQTAATNQEATLADVVCWFIANIGSVLCAGYDATLLRVLYPQIVVSVGPPFFWHELIVAQKSTEEPQPTDPVDTVFSCQKPTNMTRLLGKQKTIWSFFFPPYFY